MKKFIFRRLIISKTNSYVSAVQQSTFQQNKD